jgi:hypothetical protein
MAAAGPIVNDIACPPSAGVVVLPGFIKSAGKFFGGNPGKIVDRIINALGEETIAVKRQNQHP